jgi:hypothetical protein
MDHLYNELQHFIRVLETFNRHMEQNWDDLQQTWDRADELWTDSQRQEFEGMWREMGLTLKVYREQYGDRYLQFLLQRKWALDEYFGQ